MITNKTMHTSQLEALREVLEASYTLGILDSQRGQEEAIEAALELIDNVLDNSSDVDLNIEVWEK